MFCGHCGTKLAQKAQFCGKCGKKVKGDVSESPARAETPHRSEGFFRRFLNFRRKKGFFESLLWYVFLLVTTALLHLYYPEDSGSVVYLVNTGMSLIVVSTIIALRGWKFNSQSLWTLATSLVLSLFAGLFGGLLPLFYILMSENQLIDMSPDLRKSMHNFISRGFLVYFVGNILSAGGAILVEEGDTYYLFWGAILYGLFLVLKGVFHAISPSSVEKTVKSEEAVTTTPSTTSQSLKNMLKTFLIVLLGGAVLIFFIALLE